MSTHLHKLNGIRQVVEVVLVVGIVLGHIAGVAKDGLDESTRSGGGLDANLHVFRIIERIEDMEDIHSGVVCLLAEGINNVVRVGGVTDGVGATEEHLEAHVGNFGTEGLQSSPRALMEESHRHIKGGAAPHLETEHILRSSVRLVGGLGCLEHIDGPHTSGQETLVSISPGSVGEEDTIMLPNGTSHGLSTLLSKNVTEVRRREAGVLLTEDVIDGIKIGRGHIVERNHFRLLGVGTKSLGMAIDGDVGNVLQVSLQVIELLVRRTERLLVEGIMRNGLNIEQRGIVFNKVEVKVASDEIRMRQNVEEEGDVMLHATNMVVQETTVHASDDAIPSGRPGSVLDEEGVKVGLNDHAAVGSTIETNSRTDTVTADVQHSGVGRKVSGGILGGDAALHGNTTGDNVLLVESNLLERGTTGDEEGRLDDIDSRHFFSDCMFDLDARVDFHEVVLAVLVDEELNGTSTRVLAGHGELESILQDILADAHGMMPGGGNLDQFLMTTLDGAIALPHMDDVALAVADDLDLDVLGGTNVALDEARSVAEGGQSLGRCRLEEGDEVLALTDYAHALAAATLGGLDHDGKAILIDEILGILKVGDGTVGTGDDGNAGIDGQLTGLGLVTKDLEVLHLGTDEGNARIGTGLSELGTLGKESISRMDGIDAIVLGNLDEILNVEVRTDGSSRGREEEGLIGAPAMRVVAILKGVDGHGLHVELGGGTDDAGCNFRSIGCCIVGRVL